MHWLEFPSFQALRWGRKGVFSFFGDTVHYRAYRVEHAWFDGIHDFSCLAFLDFSQINIFTKQTQS